MSLTMTLIQPSLTGQSSAIHGSTATFVYIFQWIQLCQSYGRARLRQLSKATSNGTASSCVSVIVTSDLIVGGYR